MDKIISFLIEEKEWLFSGIGVFILSFFIYRKKTRSSVKQQQRIGKKSTGIQANGDVNINIPKE